MGKQVVTNLQEMYKAESAARNGITQGSKRYSDGVVMGGSCAERPLKIMRESLGDD